MTTVAFVTDLMDRTRIATALPGTVYGRTAADARGADRVVVDLGRFAADLPAIRAATAGLLVAFGPHVDDAALAAAATAGADVVLPRSRFFRDPAAALAGGPHRQPDSPADDGYELDG